MKVTTKRLICTLLVVAMFASLGITAFADTPTIVATGFCGGDTTAEFDEDSECYKNLSWTLDENGLLTIEGTGAMKNWDGDTPWLMDGKILKAIKTVEIKSGVTSIGDYAFALFSNATIFTIPETVTSIGNYAFEYCTSLKNVTIPNSVESIGDYAFMYCEVLESIEIPKSVTSFGGTYSSAVKSLRTKAA